MALPSGYSVSLPVEVVASGGILVRQVDLNGVALDNSSYSYSVAMPVMTVDSNGVNGDGSRVFGTHLRVTIDPNGFPVIRVDTSGNAISTPFGGGTAGQPIGGLLLTLTKAS